MSNPKSLTDPQPFYFSCKTFHFHKWTLLFSMATDLINPVYLACRSIVKRTMSFFLTWKMRKTNVCSTANDTTRFVCVVVYTPPYFALTHCTYCARCLLWFSKLLIIYSIKSEKKQGIRWRSTNIICVCFKLIGLLLDPGILASTNLYRLFSLFIVSYL